MNTEYGYIFDEKDIKHINSLYIFELEHLLKVNKKEALINDGIMKGWCKE